MRDEGRAAERSKTISTKLIDFQHSSLGSRVGGTETAHGRSQAQGQLTPARTATELEPTTIYSPVRQASGLERE